MKLSELLNDSEIQMLQDNNRYIEFEISRGVDIDTVIELKIMLISLRVLTENNSIIDKILKHNKI